MKTLLKSVFALTLTAIVLSSTAFSNTAAAATKAPFEMSTVLKFNKIVVSGNVKLTIVHSTRPQVSVYDGYDADDVTIKQKGYTLLINSAGIKTLELTVYVDDLQRIDASKGALVNTAGKFDLKVLQIFLQDEARANVKAKIGSLYTVIKDNCDLKLSGSTDEHTLVKTNTSKLNIANFAALKTTTTFLEGELAGGKINTVVAK